MVAVLLLHPPARVIEVDAQRKKGIALGRHQPPAMAVVCRAKEPGRLELLPFPPSEAIPFGGLRRLPAKARETIRQTGEKENNYLSHRPRSMTPSFSLKLYSQASVSRTSG